MSPHAMTSLVNDLVEMAKAVELLPQVQAELDRARETIDHRGQHIEQLELKAHAYKQEIETLHSTIRSLEVARDDAELRFLELDEHATKAIDFARTATINMEAVMALLSPPKAQPEPEPINPHANEPLPVSPALHEDAGQSEGHPTATKVTIQSQDATTQNVETWDRVDTTSHSAIEPPVGLYSGKRYIDVPGWVSREDWLAGGGTQYDYDWRYGQDYLPF